MDHEKRARQGVASAREGRRRGTGTRVGRSHGPNRTAGCLGRVGGQRLFFFLQKIFSPCSVSARVLRSLRLPLADSIGSVGCTSTAQLLAWGRCAMTLTSTAGGRAWCAAPARSQPSVRPTKRPTSFDLLTQGRAAGRKTAGRRQKKKSGCLMLMMVPAG